MNNKKYILIFLSLVLAILVGIIYDRAFLADYKDEALTGENEIKFQNNLPQSKTKRDIRPYIMDRLEIHLVEDDQEVSFYLVDNEVVREENSTIFFLTNDGYEKSHLKISPNNSKIGYFSSLNYSKFKEVTEIDYGNYTSLNIMTIDGKTHKEIYRGNYHTSTWEWLDDDELVVYYGCGTECMVGFVIDVKTGEQKAQLQYGVGHKWSPDKKLVLAYNYSGKYGITIGNRNGDKLFSLRRDSPYNYSPLTFETKAQWSPDGNRIALIIKKESQEMQEVLIFNAKRNFQTIFQADLELPISPRKMSWSNDSKTVFLDELTIFL